MELDAIRTEIDKVNEELLRLFEKRMALCGQVAAYKQAHHMEVFVPAREVAILEKVRQLADPAFSEYDLRFFNTLLSLSREHQQKLLEEGNKGNGLPAELQTPGLHLVPLTEKAAAAVFSLTSNPSIMQPPGFPVHRSPEETAEFIREMTGLGCYAYAVLNREQQLIGVCGFIPCRNEDSCMILRILPVSDAELLRLLADAARKFLAVRFLRTDLPVECIPARRLFEQCGFTAGAVYPCPDSDGLRREYRLSL